MQISCLFISTAKIRRPRSCYHAYQSTPLIAIKALPDIVIAHNCSLNIKLINYYYSDLFAICHFLSQITYIKQVVKLL